MHVPLSVPDTLVWTNDHVMQWIQNIGLKEYSNNLLECGIHGALIALDETFDFCSLALILQIPMQNTQVRIAQMLKDFCNVLTYKTHLFDMVVQHTEGLSKILYL